ncbi:Dynactin subunit 2 [Actinomortierella wolfii]|nr:Dynactin subunit 2 [Actinomortierella wolfii]
MSNKYSTLPDIDTQPDVYETADDDVERNLNVLGMDSKDIESDEEREGIDRSAVSVRDATARFKNATGDNGNGTTIEIMRNSIHNMDEEDFANNLNRRKKAMYNTFLRRPALDSTEYEILPKDLALQETPLQKLRRLQFEIKELAQEAELNEKQGVQLEGGRISHKDLMANVKSLESDLSEISQKLDEGAAAGVLSNEGLIKQTDAGRRLLQQLMALKNLSVDGEDKSAESAAATAAATTSATETSATTGEAGGSNNVTYELYYNPDSARLHNAAKAAELNERLSMLEKMVGSSQLPTGQSLVGSVEKLEQQIGILTQPRQLEQLSRRLKVVIAELDRMQELQTKEGSTTGISSEVENKINTLFDLVDKIDPLVALVPALVTRLKGLKTLHSEAAVFSDSIKMISSEQTKIGDELKSLDAVSTKLQESMAENEAAIQKNVELIDSRITALVERVQKLGA